MKALKYAVLAPWIFAAVACHNSNNNSSASPAVAQVAQPQAVQYSFTAEVHDIMPVAQYQGGSPIATCTNPKYVIVLENIHGVSGPAPARPDGKLRYAIGSTVKTFRLPLAGVKGKTFKFTLQRSGNTQIWAMTAQRTKPQAR